MKKNAKQLLIGVSCLAAFYAVFFVSLGVYIHACNPDAGIRGGDGFEKVTPQCMMSPSENATLHSGESLQMEAPYVHATKAVAISTNLSIENLEIGFLYNETWSEPERFVEEEKIDLTYLPYREFEKTETENLYYHQFSYNRPDIKGVKITYIGEGDINIGKAMFLKVK